MSNDSRSRQCKWRPMTIKHLQMWPVKWQQRCTHNMNVCERASGSVEHGGPRRCVVCTVFEGCPPVVAPTAPSGAQSCAEVCERQCCVVVDSAEGYVQVASSGSEVATYTRSRCRSACRWAVTMGLSLRCLHKVDTDYQVAVQEARSAG